MKYLIKYLKKDQKNNQEYFPNRYLIQCENEKYEPKNEKETNNILMDKIYFNKNNLSSFLKIEKNNKKKIIDDEIIESFKKIKNFNDNEEFILKKLKQNYNSKWARSNNLSNSSNIKFKDVIKNKF